MDLSLELEGRITNPRTLMQAVGAMLRNYWDGATGYQRFAYGVGFLLLGSALFHSIVFLVSGDSWYGAVSWRKPILFAQSFGLTAISLAWVMTFLPKRRVIGWLLMGGLGIANFGEVFWVTMQRWRNVPAHFNYTTPFDEAVFIAAGFLIAVTASVILLITIASFIWLRAPRSLAWAIRIGMLLLLTSQVVGFTIIENGNEAVRNLHTGEYLPEKVDDASVKEPAGAMKSPHALTLHAIQVLPAMALLLLFTPWSESRRTQVIITGGAGYMGLVAIAVWQTYNGRAFFDLNVLGMLLLGLSVTLLVGAGILVLFALRQTFMRNSTAYS